MSFDLVYARGSDGMAGVEVVGMGELRVIEPPSDEGLEEELTLIASRVKELFEDQDRLIIVAPNGEFVTAGRAPFKWSDFIYGMRSAEFSILSEVSTGVVERRDED